MGSDMRSPTRTSAARRLAIARGHLAAIERMVSEGRTCVDVLQQTYALRESVRRVECLLVEECLNETLITGARSGNENEIVGRLTELYALTKR